MRGQGNKELSQTSACHTSVNLSSSVGKEDEGSPLKHVGGRLLEEAQLSCSPIDARTLRTAGVQEHPGAATSSGVAGRAMLAHSHWAQPWVLALLSFSRGDSVSNVALELSTLWSEGKHSHPPKNAIPKHAAPTRETRTF